MAFTLRDQAAQGQLTSALGLFRREAAFQLERNRAGWSAGGGPGPPTEPRLCTRTQASTGGTSLVPPPAARARPALCGHQKAKERAPACWASGLIPIPGLSQNTRAEPS